MCIYNASSYVFIYPDKIIFQRLMASQVKLFKPSVYHLKHLKFSIRHYIDLCHYSSRLKKVLYMCFVRENGLIRLTFVVDIMGKISETFALDTVRIFGFHCIFRSARTQPVGCLRYVSIYSRRVHT